LEPFKAKPLRPQALSLFIERLNFIGALRVPGFRGIGLAELFQRFFHGKLGCFSHGKPHVEATSVEIMAKLAICSRMLQQIQRGHPLIQINKRCATAICFYTLESHGRHAQISLRLFRHIFASEFVSGACDGAVAYAVPQ